MLLYRRQNETEVFEPSQHCNMRIQRRGNYILNRNLVHRRIRKIAVVIVSMLMETTPQCDAQQTTNKFTEPSGEALPHIRTVAPKILSVGNISAIATRPKIALALGGGGMRGAAHVGVLRTFVKAGIPIDMIVGTSIGAIVGGLYSTGIDVDNLEKKFVDGSLMKSFMPLPLKLTLMAAPMMAVPKTIDRNDYDGLYSGKRFIRYIDRAVPEYQQNIESLPIPFAAVALNLVDGKTYALRRGNLGAALRASSAVPGLCEPVRIGEQLFVDGGVVDNIPVDVARSIGADIVIAVNVNERFDVMQPDAFKAVGSVAKRIVTLQLASDAAMHLQAADFVVHPHVDGIGLTSTKIKDARRAIDAGEKAAWELVPAIKYTLKQAEIRKNGDSIGE